MTEPSVKRGDIFYADLSPVVGSEQGGTRPVLIVQNDTGNRHSPTVIAAAITSQTGKARLPTHINIAGGSVGLSKDSIILLEQIRTIDKRRLREHMGHLDENQMAQVDDAIARFGRDRVAVVLGTSSTSVSPSQPPIATCAIQPSRQRSTQRTTHCARATAPAPIAIASTTCSAPMKRIAGNRSSSVSTSRRGRLTAFAPA